MILKIVNKINIILDNINMNTAFKKYNKSGNF